MIRERKVRCDRALPKCRFVFQNNITPLQIPDQVIHKEMKLILLRKSLLRRCDRLNQSCSYNQTHQRRTRDDQLKQLQERLAKTEAQLALTTSRSPLSVRSQSRSEVRESSISSKWTGTPDSFTPNTCSRRSSQYQLPATITPNSQLASLLEHTATTTPMDLGNSREINAAIDMPTNGSSLLDTDLFTSLAEGAESHMTFPWANQPLMALEPLDNLLLNQPQSLPQSGSEEDLSSTDLSLLHNHYFDSVYFSFPFLNKDRFTAESAGGGSPAVSALIYAVALAGCAHSPNDPYRQSTCYNLARNYAERCEREDYLTDLNFLQALLLIGRFEAMSRKLERSWLTLGRAAMLCRLLRLHRMDEAGDDLGMYNGEASGGSLLSLPHTEDLVLLEERRRTFWGLYILQSYVRTRTGWQCQLGDVKVGIALLYRSTLEALTMSRTSESTCHHQGY